MDNIGSFSGLKRQGRDSDQLSPVRIYLTSTKQIDAKIYFVGD
jgi:hypothetical protein